MKKQIATITLILGLCALVVDSLYIPSGEREAEEHPKLQFYKDSNYSIEKILEDLSNDYNLSNHTTFEDKKRTRRSTCSATRLYGGNSGGGYFDDGCTAGIARIDIHEDHYTMRSIQAVYRKTSGQYTAPVHGVPDGTFHRVHLAQNEQIIAVVGRAGPGYRNGRVYQLAFLTNLHNHVFGPYGPSDGPLFIVYKNVVSFIGRSGADLDSIGFRYVY